ncbi:sigma-70 family RNA polymerase sigma factor [Clostridium beijerinckii]|uniref:sigma-70 family RNA polymerase sigma factor n=1 Tax=Clostridium beijerinckii TaxID=1520 RepID=UPI00098CAE91|nr:sigma-70 family RNA polymerase sigma factor [Clostridium beijerinckii]NRT76338.1 RNA polymerase sigma factor (sigma-70 family) [Clostridium beijerinckii]OOM48625.1 RNA polymerase sigma-F factor [Clostridium beijerinckii]
MGSNVVKRLIKFKNRTENLTSKEVCEKFSGLVYNLCKRWTIRYEIEDLKQIGFIGLIKAYNAYDINKKVLFTTFATMIINNELNRNYKSDKSQHIVITSLNKVINNNQDNETEFIEGIHDDNDYEDIALTNIECENLKAAIDKLEPINKTIVELVAFQNKTQVEVSKTLNISSTSVSRKYKDSLNKIKNIMEGDDSMPVQKLSKEELLAHIKRYGTNKVALNEIAQKYGINLSTIKSYLDVWDIRKYAKNYQGHKQIKESIEESSVIEEKPILQLVKLYKGSIGEYEIKENHIDLKLKTGTITIEKENINNLVAELKELNKLIV